MIRRFADAPLGTRVQATLALAAVSWGLLVSSLVGARVIREFGRLPPDALFWMTGLVLGAGLYTLVVGGFPIFNVLVVSFWLGPRRHPGATPWTVDEVLSRHLRLALLETLIVAGPLAASGAWRWWIAPALGL